MSEDSENPVDQYAEVSSSGDHTIRYLPPDLAPDTEAALQTAISIHEDEERRKNTANTKASIVIGVNAIPVAIAALLETSITSNAIAVSLLLVATSVGAALYSIMIRMYYRPKLPLGAMENINLSADEYRGDLAYSFIDTVQSNESIVGNKQRWLNISGLAVVLSIVALGVGIFLG